MKISSISIAAAILPNAVWAQLETTATLRASRSLEEDLLAFEDGDGASLAPTSLSIQYIGHGGEHGGKSGKGPEHGSKAGKVCNLCGDDMNKQEIKVDYLVVGGGPAGLVTASDLSKALKDIDSEKSIAVIEKSGSIGGRFESVDLVEPDGYAGPPLRAGLGALRMNPSTFPETRRLMNEYSIELHCTIFNNRMTARGREASCDLKNQCHIFGDFCSYAPQFVNETNMDEPIGAAFVGLTDVLAETGDPEGAAYLYLLGYESVNPATNNECDNAAADPNNQCPNEACKAAVDWKSFLQEHLGNEYAELINAANVGFSGDQATSINACAYLDWYLREYDTLSINCYPEGGMFALADGMYEKAMANDVEFFLEEPALCIDRIHGNNGLYEVRTPSYKFVVKEFLFLGIPNNEVLDNLNGDLIDELKAMPITKTGKGTSVASVIFQWDPNEPAWWYDEVDKAGGTYSLRKYGDLDCFARMEIVDTPYHRQHNALRVVYSDERCIDMWKGLIDDAEASGDYSKLTGRAMRAMRNAYPGREIPEPVFAKGKFWPVGWYFSAPSSTSTNQEVEDFALNPTGDVYDRLCLTGESWGLTYGGWSEGVWKTSRSCLEHRFAGSDLGDALGELFSERELIVADYYDNDPDFNAYPGEMTEGQSFPILDNEQFAPFGCLYNADGSLIDEYESGQNCGPPACSEQGVPMPEQV